MKKDEQNRLDLGAEVAAAFGIFTEVDMPEVTPPNTAEFRASATMVPAWASRLVHPEAVKA